MKQASYETCFETIILCGGSAKRMKPYLPFNKALAEVTNGQTLLEYQINWLKENNAKQITLAIDTKTYSDVSAFTPRILQEVQCSIETTKLGTGGAVRKATENVEAPLVYVMNVDDIIASDNYTPQHLLNLTKKDIKGTLLVTHTYFPFGVVETQNQYVHSFKKKPLLDYWINTGHCVLDTEYIKNCFTEKGDLDHLLSDMAKQRLLMHHKLDGNWFTINNIKQLEEAREKITNPITQNRTQVEPITNQ